MIRELKDSEHVKMTDKREDGLGIYLTEVGKTAGSFDQSIYRTEQEPATFDESANFDVVAPIHVSQEEVYYPKADVFGDKDKAIASALELFKGMDRVIPPTPNQLGVLYDAGKLK